MRVVMSIKTNSCLGKPLASFLNKAAHRSVSTLLYSSIAAISSSLKLVKCLPLVLVASRSNFAPTPNSYASFLSDTPVRDLPPKNTDVLEYCDLAMAAVHPYILGFIPNRQAKIIESKPDML